MNNLVILPILIPLITATLLLLIPKNVKLQKVISVISLTFTTIAAMVLVHTVYRDGIQTLEIGSWKPPFGIVLVADMFAALLVLTGVIVSFTCVLFSFRNIGKGRENFFFYSFTQFLITGVMGAFLTGDLFNLFVFFEVMLMSSYALIVLGGTRIQLRESIKYLLVNIISSALFVIALAYLYGLVGTLNMADVSDKIAQSGQTDIVTVVAILFLIVFGLKGGIFPLYFWLPGSYQAPPYAITAIFGALLTKVGVYSIYRIFTLIFYHEPQITHQIIAALAIITILIGAIGAIAYWDVKKILIYNIVTAVGVIIYGISIATETGYAGGIYYLVHDMVIKGALFLLAGAMFTITGTDNIKKMGGLIKRHPLLGWMFFTACLALAGIPPLSGFVGKILLVQGGLEQEHYIFVGVMLFSSLLVLYSVMKIFMNCFFREEVLSSKEEKGSTRGLVYPSVILIALSAFLGLGAEFVYPYVFEAAETLMDPSIYIQAVLKE
ncbi:MAG: Na+/H+ antiporter subunit D [Bacillota bacterium]|uniref:Na+/H+ antiporter subunit D n=1 Tax=Bacillus sp. RO2 TaxID=2723913 RepID=UPI00145F03B1|nr:Na+/H+ antiporter subunit D [Bacillus sp. RO2]MEA3320257.1 Na+/H+ antiporter subunit D [Bacillota bacterium]NMH71777.1 Na+/H+ antiporter subunit D [Bacillus sp. RO2]